MADTRKDKRAAQAIKMRFKSATLDEFVEKYSGDVSRGGCFIKTKSPMKVGTLLKFEFQLKDASRLIHGVGRVTWRREASKGPDAPAGMGIKFIKMDPDSRSLIQRIVEIRGEGPGRYDEGIAPAEATGGFFPDGPPAEQPAMEDRTSVRQASELLASALGAASDGGGQAAEEAEKAAEAARQRTAEIEAQREAERAQLAGGVPATQAPPAALAAYTAADDDDDDFDEEGVTTVASRSMLADVIAGGPPAVSERDDATVQTVATNDDSGGAALDGDSFGHRDDEPTDARPVPAAARATGPVGTKAAEDEGGGNTGLILGLVLIAAAGAAGWYFTMGPGSTGGADPSADSSGDSPLTTGAVDGMPEQTPTDVDQPPEDAAVEGAAEPNEEPTGSEDTEAVMVSVRIESTPTGTVIIGGEERGSTPLSVELPAGQATAVSVRAPSHVLMTREITPEEGEAARERFALEPMAYVLTIESNVEGASLSAAREAANESGEVTWERPPPTRFQASASADGWARGTALVRRSEFVERDGALRHSVRIQLPRRALTRPAGMTAMRPDRPAYDDVALPSPTMIEAAAMDTPAAPAPTMEPAPSTAEAAMASPPPPPADSPGSGMLIGFD